MKIPFTKAHGSRNDFLLTWLYEAPCENRVEAAVSICERHTGIGADGWLLIATPPAAETEFDAAIQIFNSDGSVPEISGNGSRCAAAILIDAGLAAGTVRIHTGAGVKSLRLLGRTGPSFVFEMNMGTPRFPEGVRTTVDLASGPHSVTVVDVGNPQCVVQVSDFDFDWRAMGAEIERHPRFPNRSNVSFVRRVDEHTLEVRFFERGAGETMSSGTGSTGAVAAALQLGLAVSPVTVLTPAGPLELRSQDDIYLVGPAQIIGRGEFNFDATNT